MWMVCAPCQYMSKSTNIAERYIKHAWYRLGCRIGTGLVMGLADPACNNCLFAVWVPRSPISMSARAGRWNNGTVHDSGWRSSCVTCWLGTHAFRCSCRIYSVGWEGLKPLDGRVSRTGRTRWSTTLDRRKENPEQSRETKLATDLLSSNTVPTGVCSK